MAVAMPNGIVHYPQIIDGMLPLLIVTQQHHFLKRWLSLRSIMAQCWPAVRLGMLCLCTPCLCSVSFLGAERH